MCDKNNDVSAHELYKMLVNKYIADASIAMINNIKTCHHCIEIPEQHSKIANDLFEHWLKKGFAVGRVYTKVEGMCCDGSPLDDRISSINLTWLVS
jgi:hypothetical protein